MLSSGLTLIFSMMSILNFAHAAFYMLGAYFAYQISATIGFWPGLVIAPLIVGFLGGLVERYGLRKAHRFGPVAELLFTFGLSFLAVEAVQLVWGKAAVDYRVPAALQGALFTFRGTSYPLYKAFMMVVSVGMLLALYAGLAFTRIGLIIQAFMVGLDWSLIDVLRALHIEMGSAPALTRLSLTQLAPIMPYLLMVVILIVRPRGLMGARET